MPIDNPLSAEDEAAVQLIVGRIRAGKKPMPSLEEIARDLMREFGFVRGNKEGAKIFDSFAASIISTLCKVRAQALSDQQAEIERLRSALKPLADLAVAIDGSPSCADHKRSDNSTIWQGNAMQRGPWDITMAHARAARAALEA